MTRHQRMQRKLGSSTRGARARKLVRRWERTGGMRQPRPALMSRPDLDGIFGIGPMAPQPKKRTPKWVRPSSLFPHRESAD